MSKELKFLSEVWKPVKGFESFYEVSDCGNIRSIERYINLPTHSYLKKQKLLTQFKDGRGYKHVKLYDGFGHPKSLCIHRVVLPTFLENSDNLPEINHMDGNKLNNRLDNLEWCTRSYNIEHIYANGLRDPSTYKGSGNHNSKLTEEQVINIRSDRRLYKSLYRELAEKYNVGTTLIGYIVNNQVWNHV